MKTLKKLSNKKLNKLEDRIMNKQVNLPSKNDELSKRLARAVYHIFIERLDRLGIK